MSCTLTSAPPLMRTSTHEACPSLAAL
jgi:hypothetical protein